MNPKLIATLLSLAGRFGTGSNVAGGQNTLRALQEVAKSGDFQRLGGESAYKTKLASAISAIFGERAGESVEALLQTETEEEAERILLDYRYSKSVADLDDDARSILFDEGKVGVTDGRLGGRDAAVAGASFDAIYEFGCAYENVQRRLGVQLFEDINLLLTADADMFEEYVRQKERGTVFRRR